MMDSDPEGPALKSIGDILRELSQRLERLEAEVFGEEQPATLSLGDARRAFLAKVKERKR